MANLICRLLVGAAGLWSLTATGCEGLPKCRDVAVAEAPKEDVKYVLVEYASGGQVGEAPKLEISDTPTYQRERANLRAAAIRLPDSCSREGVTAVTGVAVGAQAPSQSIAETLCGTWLGEIERAVAGAGFRVISWDALKQAERQKNLSTYVAAQQLGADIVFVFNSLEAAPLRAGAKKETSFKYFTADVRGVRGPPVAILESDRHKLREFVAARVPRNDAASAVIALSSTLDTTAILTNGANAGESVWFYRRTVTKPLRHGGGMRFLFEQRAGGFWPVKPAGATEESLAEPRDTAATEDVSSSHASAEVDAYASERLELVRASARDFIGRFRGAPAASIGAPSTGAGASQ